MSGFDGRQIQVLIVEDNDNFRRLLRTILGAIGIRDVIEAADGAEAIAKLRTSMPDLALVDWRMEGMDGLSFVHHIRRDPDSPNPYLPVIMVTGYTESGLVMAARDAGVHEFLAKPISAKSLLSRILSVLQSVRPFVRSNDYFGPDRRRRQIALSGPDRRRSAARRAAGE